MRKNTLNTILVILSLCIMGTALAAVNAITPSTNDQNRINGWAHVNQDSIDPGSTDLTFVSTRGFASCFEYRTDGDLSQSTGNNYNPGVLDGLYPYTCVNNSTTTVTIEAGEYVEVRMVFGAESDERFDWTRFDVEPLPPANVPANASWALWVLIASLLAVSGHYLSRKKHQS